MRNLKFVLRNAKPLDQMEACVLKIFGGTSNGHSPLWTSCVSEYHKHQDLMKYREVPLSPAATE